MNQKSKHPLDHDIPIVVFEGHRFEVWTDLKTIGASKHRAVALLQAIRKLESTLDQLREQFRGSF